MLKIILSGIIRGFRKSKLDFFLNMVALSVAMIVFFGISIYVKNELSFDKYHKDSNRVFRITTSLTSPNGQQTNMALANTALMYSEINGAGKLVDRGDFFACCKLNSSALRNLPDKVNQLATEKYYELLKQMDGFKLSHNLRQ